MIPDALMRNMSDEDLARAIYCAADMPPIAAELARRLVAAADACTAAEDELRAAEDELRVVEDELRAAEAAPEYECPYCDGEYD